MLLNYADCIFRLNQTLQNIDSLQDRYIVLHSIRVGCEKQNLPQQSKEIVYYWIQDRIEQALNEIGRVEENDGAILVLIAKKFAKATIVNRYALTPNLPHSHS